MGMSVATPAQETVERITSPNYKWLVLANTTMGTLIATIDSSIIIIALPEIFRGIGLNPLEPRNTFYLLWMLMGFIIVSSVLVVSFGRLGDIFGRVKIYKFGFVFYSFFSLMLAIDPLTAQAGAMWLVVGRIFQGVGAAFITGNSGAILTDVFPANQRGLALGIGNVAGISGSFLGLVLGGVLSAIDWRLVFLASVPFGIGGSIWSILLLKKIGHRRVTSIDWLGNLTFGAGLIALMIGITDGIEPAGGQMMSWTSPKVLSLCLGGVAMLVLFVFIESRVENPMFRLPLFKIRAFTFGTLSTFLSAIGRGGLMFMLIVWLQGIWLPLHGYSFEETPFWAGILMLPMTIGFLLAGPISGYVSDKAGARWFTAGGMLVAAFSFVLLIFLPVNFNYDAFAAILLVNGLAMGAFAAPNRAAIMNALPPDDRGAGGGMNSTFQNSAQVFSIGIFFTLILNGLAGSLSQTMVQGLLRHGVPAAQADAIGRLPPVSILFAAFLGYNPIQNLLGPHVLAGLAPADAATLTGHEFFPNLISGPFHAGLADAFIFAALACLIAAAASWTRGRRYVHEE